MFEMCELLFFRFVFQYWPKAVINFSLLGRLSQTLTVPVNIFATFSSWLVVALTIDRLILVKLPTRAKTLSTAKRTYIIILLIFVLSIAVNASYIAEIFEVPVFIDSCSGYWGIPKQIIKEDNSVHVPLRHNDTHTLLATTTSVLFFYALPTTVMIVCNIVIVRSLRSNKIGSATQKASRRRQAEAKLTKMIMVISACYIICNLPDTITRVLWKYFNPKIVGKIQPIAHLFLMINVGANFVVYSLFNKQLFATVMALCTKCVGFASNNLTKSETCSQKTSSTTVRSHSDTGM